jgi:hypothetical protein
MTLIRHATPSTLDLPPTDFITRPAAKVAPGVMKIKRHQRPASPEN